MSKQVLDVQQMQHLQELGLDTNNASMCWLKTPNGRDLTFNDECINNDEWINLDESLLDPVPAYTLQDVLDAMPEKIMNKSKDYLIEIWKRDGEWTTGYLFFDIEEDVVHLHDETDKSLIDAAYSMLCWCIEQGYVETNKNG